MPGIFGFQWKRDGSRGRSQELIDEMSRALLYHDGFSASLYSSGATGFGVVDLSTSGSAAVHIDERTGIACAKYGAIFTIGGNGCSGADVDAGSAEKQIVSAYLRQGAALANAVDGDGNVVIHDPGENRLVLFNDRFGFRHTYLYEDDQILIFAPHASAFLCYPGFSDSIDQQGVADYFNYFYHLGDRTMFEKVRLLPAACSVTLDDRGVRRSIYWEPRYTGELGDADLDDAVETGYGLFRQSMERRTRNGKRFLVPLSGGLDSRLILAVALELGCDVSAATFGSEKGHDYRVAVALCRELGVTDHTRVGIQKDWIPRYGEELVRMGGGGYGTLATTRICGFARVMGTDFDGLLNGIFGGHLSFGSPYFRQRDLDDRALADGKLDRIVNGLEGHRYEYYLAGCASRELNDAVRAHRQESIREEWELTAASSPDPAFRKDQFYLRNRIRRGMNCLDMNRYFYRSLLPFASFDLYRFYLSLGSELLLGHRLYKEIFKRKLPQLARIPWSNTGVDLYSRPSAAHMRKTSLKRKFIWYSRKLTRGIFEWTDQDRYMHYDRDFRRCLRLRSWVEGILLSDRFLDRGYFHREGMLQLLKKEQWGHELFYEIGKLVVFELWARRFLDRVEPVAEAAALRTIPLWDRLTGCHRFQPPCLEMKHSPPVDGASV